MCIIIDIDTDIATTVLRVLAAVLTGAAPLCWARVGSKCMAPALTMVLVFLIAEIDSGWMKHIDSTVEGLVRPHRSPDSVAVGVEIWILMSHPIYFSLAVAACGIAFSWRARSARPGIVLVAAVGAAFVLEHTLKATVVRTTVAALQDRPRPGTVLDFLQSFPSGHASVIGVFLGTVAVFLGSGRPAARKIQLAFVIAVCAVFIGVDAVYIRAHTTTDVIGGIVLAGAIVAAAAVVVHSPAARRYPVARRNPAATSPADRRSAQLPVPRRRVLVS